MNIVMAKVGKREEDGKCYWLLVYEDDSYQQGLEDDLYAAFAHIREVFEERAEVG